jgi:hypothetical protein
MFKISDVAINEEYTNVPGDWHWKMAPLDDRLRQRFQDAVILGSRVAYNEIMLPFRGRSAHRTKVPGKPDPDGIKEWALCCDRYLWDWLYYSALCGNPAL